VPFILSLDFKQVIEGFSYLVPFHLALFVPR